SWLVVAWPARAVIRSSLSRPCSIRTAAAVERVQHRRARMSSRRATTLGVRFTEIFSVLVSSMCGTLPQSAESGPRPQPAGLGALTSGTTGADPSHSGRYADMPQGAVAAACGLPPLRERSRSNDHSVL